LFDLNLIFKFLNDYYSVEIIFLQLIIYCSIIIFYSLSNTFSQIGFFTIICVFIGFVLAYLNFELFTMILWLVESISVMSLIIFSFFFFSNFQKYKNRDTSLIFYSYTFIILVCFNFISFFWNDFSNFSLIFLHDKSLWVYYSFYLFCSHSNDFLILYINLYEVNFVQFIFVGLLLFFASIVIIFLYKQVYQKNENNFFYFLKNKKLVRLTSFFQKQNFFLQEISKITTFFFKSKK